MKHFALFFSMMIVLVATSANYSENEIILKFPGNYNKPQFEKILLEQNLKLIEILSRPMTIVLVRSNLKIKEQIALFRKNKSR